VGSGVDSVVLGLSPAVGDDEVESDAEGSLAVGLFPSSSPHPTTVTATSARPATALGIPLMRPVCLVFSKVTPTSFRTAANLRRFRTVVDVTAGWVCRRTTL
jgi:hypothetical protein